MSFALKYNNSKSKNDDNFSYIKENLIFILKRTHWIVISIIISYSIAHFKLKYATPYYKSTARVLFKNDENGGLFNESSAFQDLGYWQNYSPIENEIETLKSRSLMRKVVKELKLNIVWFKEDGLITKEEYENPSLKLTVVNGDSTIYNEQATFNIEVLSETDFIIQNESKNFKYKGAFGKPFQTYLGELILTPQRNKRIQANTKLTLWIYNLDVAVNMYTASLEIDRPNDMSNILEISVLDNSVKKATDIVNSLIKQHQNETIIDKNQVSVNSANFINDRIKIISNELEDVEGDVLSLKTNKNIVDVSSEATVFIETLQEVEKNIVDNEIQLKLAEYVNDYLANDISVNNLLPTNIGLADFSIENSINSYNNLVLERNRILKNSNERNPIAQNLESKILNLQSNLKESLKKLEVTLKLKTRELKLRKSKLDGQLSSVPKKEKELREIQRQQQIKEQLYLYLLQKREETAITLSLTVANSRVIDEAYSNGNIVSPNYKSTYLFFIFIGFLIPLIIIIIIKNSNRLVHSKESIEEFGLKVITEIPTIYENKENKLFNENEKTSFGESFRLLRTNIDFVLNLIKPKNKVILVTSSLPNEGKSFISLNLAHSLSLINKKILVIGLDLRAPSLHKYLNINQTNGVSNFIIDDKINVSEIIIKNVEGYKFDFINSGDIPPNPSELIQQDRLIELFKELEQKYDYIIIDTPPIGIVSDAFLLNKFVDLTLFVVRRNYVKLNAINSIWNFHKENKLKNVNVIFNCSKELEQYEYKYAYYYGKTEKQNLFKRIMLFFRK